MINRRDFLRLSTATTLCACAGALGIGGCSDGETGLPIPLAPSGSYRHVGSRITIELSHLTPLQQVGGIARIVLGENEESALNLLLLRTEHDTYRAIADQCTHNGKHLVYLPEKSRLVCQSGRSHFDYDGNILRGPAEVPLRVYPSRRTGDQLIIEFVG
jgi:nitrite reductase/ring-hydroxylating ferredoxin subunit